MRLRAVRWALASALVVMTGAAGVASVGHAVPGPTPCGGRTSIAGKAWTASDTGLSRITTLRAVTYAPERVFVTDGSAVRRTDDAGCGWRTLVLPPITVGGAVDLGALQEAVHITDVSAPSNPNSAAYVYVAGDVSVTDALPTTLPSQPVVFASSTGGDSFVASSKGLPTVGTVAEITASDLAPRNLYALVTGAGSSSGIYVSNDAGSTWALRSSDTGVTHLRVNPIVLNQLYGLRAGQGLVHSFDGGASFTRMPIAGADVDSFSATAGGGSVQLAQGHASSSRFDVSRTAGVTWQSHLAPEHAQSVAIAATVPVVAVYDRSKLSVEQLQGPTAVHTVLTPAPGSPVPGSVQVSAPAGSRLALAGVSPDRKHLLRAVYDIYTNKPVVATLTPIRLLRTTTVKQFPSSLRGAVTSVHLAAGAHRDVPYSLLLPRTPSPVDLMFLVDTTRSTDQTIDGVRQGLQSIVNELRSTGLDAEFGLGDFKDYPYWANGDGADTDYPYKLRRRIGPVDATLQRAVAALKSDGGGDPPESDLTALYQSTLGVGQRVTDDSGLAPVKRYAVAPGQQAGYRPQSLRLAFVATDEPYHHEPGYVTPSWGATVQALVSHGVHQIGLAVESTDSEGKVMPGVYDALPDERRMARDTGAFAPPGGVDCDGNGTTDIAAGQPLACTIAKPADKRIKVPVGSGVALGGSPPPVHLAPLVVQLAESIPELRPVGLQIAGGPAALAQVVSHPVAPTVNVRTDNNLGFIVRYTCPRSKAAHTWPLTVTASAASRRLASVRTVVQCDPVAPKTAAVVPPAAAVAVVAAAAPAPPPNPPTNVTSNINPNPAVNPNAGFAQQDEQQPQLALADAEQGAQEDTALAMSRRRTDSQAELMLGAAALMTATAAGYATRHRWRAALTHR